MCSCHILEKHLRNFYHEKVLFSKSAVVFFVVFANIAHNGALQRYLGRKPARSRWLSCNILSHFAL